MRRLKQMISEAEGGKSSDNETASMSLNDLKKQMNPNQTSRISLSCAETNNADGSYTKRENELPQANL